MAEPVNPGVQASVQVMPGTGSASRFRVAPGRQREGVAETAVWTTDEDGFPLRLELREVGAEVVYAHPDSRHLWEYTSALASGLPYLLPESHPSVVEAREKRA